MGIQTFVAASLILVVAVPIPAAGILMLAAKHNSLAGPFRTLTDSMIHQLFSNALIHVWDQMKWKLTAFVSLTADGQIVLPV